MQRQLLANPKAFAPAIEGGGKQAQRGRSHYASHILGQTRVTKESIMKNALRTFGLQAHVRSAALVVALAANALPAMGNLVTNGSFESTTVSTTTQWFCPGSCVVNNWTLLNDNAFGNNGQILVDSSWNGVNLIGTVGIAGSIGLASPDGGNFIFSDADFHNSTFTQTITGLTLGDTYLLSFYQALVQDTEPGITIPGPVSAAWMVGFGAATQTSAGMTANGATLTTSPWALQTMTFTATSATQVLSFLSIGAGDPPLIALDGISLEHVPEPGSAALVLLAGILAGGVYRRTRWQRLQA